VLSRALFMISWDSTFDFEISKYQCGYLINAIFVR
jgi:hypothetical protein